MLEWRAGYGVSGMQKYLFPVEVDALTPLPSVPTLFHFYCGSLNLRSRQIRLL